MSNSLDKINVQYITIAFVIIVLVCIICSVLSSAMKQKCNNIIKTYSNRYLRICQLNEILNNFILAHDGFTCIYSSMNRDHPQKNLKAFRSFDYDKAVRNEINNSYVANDIILSYGAVKDYINELTSLPPYIGFDDIDKEWGHIKYKVLHECEVSLCKECINVLANGVFCDYKISYTSPAGRNHYFDYKRYKLDDIMKFVQNDSSVNNQRKDIFLKNQRKGKYSDVPDQMTPSYSVDSDVSLISAQIIDKSQLPSLNEDKSVIIIEEPVNPKESVAEVKKNDIAKFDNVKKTRIVSDNKDIGSEYSDIHLSYNYQTNRLEMDRMSEQEAMLRRRAPLLYNKYCVGCKASDNMVLDKFRIVDKSLEKNLNDYATVIRNEAGVKEDFTGIYIIYNSVRHKWYVGQGKKAIKRSLAHFKENDNAPEIRRDWLRGDFLSVNYIKLKDVDFDSLDELEDFYIRKYECVEKGYNHIGGNKTNK